LSVILSRLLLSSRRIRQKSMRGNELAVYT
jgi:hypothetical protein